MITPYGPVNSISKTICGTNEVQPKPLPSVDQTVQQFKSEPNLAGLSSDCAKIVWSALAGRPPRGYTPGSYIVVLKAFVTREQAE
jgi:hypothetical protein